MVWWSLRTPLERLLGQIIKKHLFMATLDKIFCTTNFEQKFPLAFVSVKARATSDHTPLILDLGIKEVKKPKIFRFEKRWLEQPDFKDLVIKIWDTPCAYYDL